MIPFLIGIGIALSGFVIGFLFGERYQQIRIQRAWRENQQRVAEVRDRALRKVEAEERKPPAA